MRACVELSVATHLPFEYFRDMETRLLETYIDALTRR